MTLVISVFEQGMIYAIMALGMYITYKILDFPDMTVDGSFPLGASLSAVLISQGMNPYLTLLLSFAAGLMAGTITGLIHVKLKVRDILASIIMMTALYSVNLRIAGKANLPIYNYDNIYNNSLTNHLLGGALSPYKNLIIIAIIVVVVKCVLDWYLKTKSGYLLKAVGDNETLVTSMGIDKGKIKILGLAIANGLVSLSGSMFAQQQRHWSGIGHHWNSTFRTDQRFWIFYQRDPGIHPLQGLCGSSHPYRTTIHGLKTGNGSLIPLDPGTFLKDREISGQKA